MDGLFPFFYHPSSEPASASASSPNSTDLPSYFYLPIHFSLIDSTVTDNSHEIGSEATPISQPTAAPSPPASGTQMLLSSVAALFRVVSVNGILVVWMGIVRIRWAIGMMFILGSFLSSVLFASHPRPFLLPPISNMSLSSAIGCGLEENTKRVQRTYADIYPIAAKGPQSATRITIQTITTNGVAAPLISQRLS